MHEEPATGNDGLIVKTADERARILERSLQEYSAQGWRIETRSEFEATVAKRTAFSYGLNVFLTIITFGLWKVVLVRTGGRGGVKHHTISVDGSATSLIEPQGHPALESLAAWTPDRRRGR